MHLMPRLLNCYVISGICKRDSFGRNLDFSINGCKVILVYIGSTVLLRNVANLKFEYLLLSVIKMSLYPNSTVTILLIQNQFYNICSLRSLAYKVC